MTAAEALQAGRARLAHSSPNARRDAELLLAHVLHWDQAALLTHPERELSAAESAQFGSYVTRRLAAEPIQYITGTQEFFGLSFEVSPAVLIPRPETEHLVEAALARVRREASLHILDVGTGSGAIAVTLAHALPRSRVTAIDLSSAALDVARSNAAKHRVLERMTFLQSDLLAAVDHEEFDLVVSNPPYVPEADELELQVAKYEPAAALFAGPTGLEIYQRLIPQCRKALKSSGWLILEIGFGQLAAVERLLGGWAAVGSINDLQGIPRVVQAQRMG